jgi:hypothetical protein
MNNNLIVPSSGRRGRKNQMGVKLRTPPSSDPPPYSPAGADLLLWHEYWNGDALDHSGNGNNGTLVGTLFHPPTFGALGLTFDPARNNFVDLPALNFDRNFMTIWAWLLYTGTDNGRYFIWASEEIDVNPGLEVQGIDASNALFASAYAASYVMQATDVFVPGTWQMISFSRNGGGVASSEVYINNVLATLITNGTQTLATGSNAASICRKSAAGGSYFKGTIGEILLFNAKKTSAEIAAYFDATKARYGL